jgi:hypothetical protein
MVKTEEKQESNGKRTTLEKKSMATREERGGRE